MTKLDRVGRSVRNLCEVAAELDGNGAGWQVLDRWLTRASAGLCLLAAAAWTATTVPGLTTPGTAVIAVIAALGITAARCCW